VTSGGAGLVLAVDGGNSKTDLALLDPSGALLAVVRGDGSSPHDLGVDGSARQLANLLDRALADAGVDTVGGPLAATAQILIAGVDLAEERAALRSAIEQLGWSEHLVVDTDMPALLRAGTDRGWGVAVVCGAGINCLGRGPDGREVRFLSLGRISGDWGGGPDVGLEALAAAARATDGRGPPTLLESAVASHYGLDDPLDVARAIQLHQIPRSRIAELAPVVLRFWEKDPVAGAIVRRLVDEVVAFARAALSRLDLTGADPDVVLGGRLLRLAPDSVVDAIARGVLELAPDAHVVVASSEPVVGAALLGFDALAADAGAHERARAELDAALEGLVRSA